MPMKLLAVAVCLISVGFAQTAAVDPAKSAAPAVPAVNPPKAVAAATPSATPSTMETAARKQRDATIAAMQASIDKQRTALGGSAGNAPRSFFL
jgi:hypothetical protein